MFLKSLIITKDARIIREINFHNGLNLIVDETPITNTKETGNNVGKTTVLALVDFCLGAGAKNIYTDHEDKRSEHKLVKSFLIENQVLITLILKEDLTRDRSREVCIERNFLARKQKIQRIDGESKTDEQFEQALTDILYPGHYGKKPTFPQIISHNIRYKDLSINNTLKTLSTYTTDVEYETLYLFLLGCDFEKGDAKQELVAKIRQEQTFKNRLEKDQTKSAYETALAILEQEIQELNRRKFSFNLNPNFETDLNELNQVKYQINLNSSELGKLNIRRGLINESLQDIQSGVPNLDLQQLRQIYSQASSQIHGIQKTFEDLCRFHSEMVARKADYITKDLPQLNIDIKLKSEHLDRLLHKEADLTSAISRSESFEELEKLVVKLNEKYSKKGEYESIINQLLDSESNLDELNQRLDNIDDLLFSQDFEQQIKEQVVKFNRFFSAISQTLYGEQYALKVDPVVNTKGQRLYKFSAFNTNFSSGKKQGEISCFDIAYTQFADQEHIPCFHFLLTDKKELMHDNQLLKIAQLVNEKGIQFVASILKDKLPEELNQEKYFVVKLSQTDKLFRIESSMKG